MNKTKKYIAFLFSFLPLLLSAQNDTCNYRIQFIDFLGDGWDGATLTVVIQEDTSVYTLLDSTVGFVNVPAIQNESLQLFFSEGAFDEEISYIVFTLWGRLYLMMALFLM